MPVLVLKGHLETLWNTGAVTNLPAVLCFSLFLLQIDVTYNVPDPIAKPAFQLLVNLKEPKAEQPLAAPAPLGSAHLSPPALHRDRALGDDEDPASDQDHREYKVILETCTR